MTRPRHRAKAPHPPKASPRPKPTGPIPRHLAIAFPCGLAALLTLPLLGLGYFWDDYLFLTGGREGGGPYPYLFHGASGSFYRPLTMGAYFIPLHWLDPASGFVGHLLNLVVLVAVTALLVLVVTDLAGRRAGLVAGLLFAGSGHVASLVGWITLSQDLFAIGFTLAALWLRNRGKSALAVLAAVAAVLSKETAIVAFPLLAAWDWVAGRARRPWNVGGIAYAVAAVIWMALHPGVRSLLGRGLASGATGYIGLEHPERWGSYLLRYAMTLLNLPPFRFGTPWPDDLTIVGLLAVAAVACLWWTVDRGPEGDGRAKRPDVVRRTMLIGLGLAVPVLIAPALLVRHWGTYFAAFPAAGLAIAVAPRIARWSKPTLAFLLATFVLFGVWCRGIVPPGEEPVFCESVFKAASRAIRTVQSNFAVALPSIAPRTEVVLSIGSTGMLGIRGTLVDNQVLRVWYRDPTIVTVPTLQRNPTSGAEILARVTSDLDVIVIDPATGFVKTSGAAAQPVLVWRTLRNYAREVVADGDVDRGIRAMDVLAEFEPPEIRPYNRRVVAMMLIGSGRRRAADSLLAITPGYTRIESLRFIHRLLAEASSSESLDVAVFEAFGLSVRDPEALRYVMRELQRERSYAQAAYWADRLRALRPGDPEATKLLDAARVVGAKPSRVADVALGRGGGAR